MERIVFIIVKDKFTSGFINYMERYLCEIDKEYIIWGDNTWDKKIYDDIINCNSIYDKDSFGKIFLDSMLLRNLNDSDAIIVSGVFISLKHLITLSRKLLKKMYFQFWGADFYYYRNNSFLVKAKKFFLKLKFLQAGGIINLVENDYIQFKNIIGICMKEHYIAPVPGISKKEFDFKRYQENVDNSVKYRVLIGNSATPENQHIQVFQMIKHIKGINIICPLSYGDSEYAKMIIEEGEKCFGENFHPILDYMEKNRYIQLLSSCDIAIFNNNRQQALGNIELMLKLGKKVYLRKDTSMWEHFRKMGICMYNVDELEEIDKQRLFDIPIEMKKKNWKMMKEQEEVYLEQWKQVIRSILF